eukprot:1058034-Pelagomonas_calceolata.AAC.1
MNGITLRGCKETTLQDRYRLASEMGAFNPGCGQARDSPAKASSDVAKGFDDLGKGHGRPSFENYAKRLMDNPWLCGKEPGMASSRLPCVLITLSLKPRLKAIQDPLTDLLPPVLTAF